MYSSTTSAFSNFSLLPFYFFTRVVHLANSPSSFSSSSLSLCSLVTSSPLFSVLSPPRPNFLGPRRFRAKRCTPPRSRGPHRSLKCATSRALCPRPFSLSGRRFLRRYRYRYRRRPPPLSRVSSDPEEEEEKEEENNCGTARNEGTTCAAAAAAENDLCQKCLEFFFFFFFLFFFSF